MIKTQRVKKDPFWDAKLLEHNILKTLSYIFSNLAEVKQWSKL